MMGSKALTLTSFLLLLAISSGVRSDSCHPSGTIKGKEGSCDKEIDSDCCLSGKLYSTFNCSPKVSSHTPAIMTLNSFQVAVDGDSPTACDNKYHSDSTLVVALSSGWYDKGSRCSKYITIMANGKSVKAKVIDECDSTSGCDSDHDYQPPCRNDIVEASKAVWEALCIPEEEWGEMKVTWTDA